MADEARLIVRFEGIGGGPGGGGSSGIPAPSKPAPEKDKSLPIGSDAGTKAIADLLRLGLPQQANAAIDQAQRIGGKVASAAAQVAGAALPISAGAVSAVAGLTGGFVAGTVLAGGLTAAAAEGNRRAAEASVGSFSAELETSRALAEVRRINRQLAQARLFGDELAGINTTRSKIRDELATAFQGEREFALQLQNVAEFGALKIIQELKKFLVNDVFGANEALLPDWLQGIIRGIRISSDAISRQENRINGFLGRFKKLEHLPLPAEYSEGGIPTDEAGNRLKFDFNGPMLDQDIFN